MPACPGIVGMATLVTRNAATSAIASLAAKSGTIGPGRDRTASAGPADAESSGASMGAAARRSSDTARIPVPVRPVAVAMRVARRAVAPGRDEPELLGRARLEDAARLGQGHAPDLVQLGDDDH